MNEPIELLGYKGRLVGISHRLKLEPWYKEDELLVSVEFDPPLPASILGTAVHLPLKDYSKSELLEAVKVEGEKQLAISIEKHDEAHKRHQSEAERQAELKKLTEGIEARFD